MISHKAYVGRFVVAGVVLSLGAMGLTCLPTTPPTPTPTPTATPTPGTKLASVTVNVAALPGPYAAGFPATFTLSFTPNSTGNVAVVTAKSARSTDFLSIDADPTTSGTLPAGSGLYNTKGPSTSNTATLKVTPSNLNPLNVYVAGFSGWGNPNTSSVTVTVTQ